MNSNFCVKSPHPIASGARVDFRSQTFGNAQHWLQTSDCHRAMNRTSIIALLIFGAILGYFLSFGPESTRKFQASVYQLIAPFLSGGSGIKSKLRRCGPA